MKKFLSVVAVGLLTLNSFSAIAHDTRSWHKHPHKPAKRVVVIKPKHHHHQSHPFATAAAVLGIVVALDASGQPKVEGKNTIVLESKLIESGKVDVIENNNIVYFIKGIG